MENGKLKFRNEIFEIFILHFKQKQSTKHFSLLEETKCFLVNHFQTNMKSLYASFSHNLQKRKYIEPIKSFITSLSKKHSIIYSHNYS
jgi:DNA-directed RNA polymerase